MKTLLAETSKLVEIGGDWDRRNKLKVYDAFYSMMMRDITKAATLLQGGIATFSSTDICSYNEFMFYAIITNLLILPRSDLKKKIIDNAHVISVVIEAPKLQNLIDSLYTCTYDKLMKAVRMPHDTVETKHRKPCPLFRIVAGIGARFVG